MISYKFHRLKKHFAILRGISLAFLTLCFQPIQSQTVESNSQNPISSQQKGESKPLKVSVLGDSYSTFEGWIPEGYATWYLPNPPKARNTNVTNVDETWWMSYINSHGYKLEKNNSYSGSTICNTGHEGRDYSDRSFINRSSLLGDPDIIFVFGGTNDDWAGSPVGEFVWEDWTPEQLYSFRPAAAKLTSDLLALYPDAEIVFLINDAIGPTVQDSIKEICNHYGVKSIQLENIEKTNGHPDQVGMKQIVEQITAAGI